MRVLLIGQLLSTDGPGCFFMIERPEDSVSLYKAQIFSPFVSNGPKMTLDEFRRADVSKIPVVTSFLTDHFGSILQWLVDTQDY